MKKIIINSPKYGKKEIIVDAEDYLKYSSKSWTIRLEGRAFYAYGYFKVNGKSNRRPMHRDVLGITDSTIIVDHKNRNGLDNRRVNLRTCNKSQNGINKLKIGNFASKYMGVAWFQRDSKWRSYITLNGKQKHLGYFNDEIQAAIARDKAALEHHGEFAILNFAS